MSGRTYCRCNCLSSKYSSIHRIVWWSIVSNYAVQFGFFPTILLLSSVVGYISKSICIFVKLSKHYVTGTREYMSSLIFVERVATTWVQFIILRGQSWVIYASAYVFNDDFLQKTETCSGIGLPYYRIEQKNKKQKKRDRQKTTVSLFRV